MICYKKNIMLNSIEYLTILRWLKASLKKTKIIEFYYDTYQHELDKKDITCSLIYMDNCYVENISCHNVGSTYCEIDENGDKKNEFTDSKFKEMGLNLVGVTIVDRIYLICKNNYKVYLDKNFYLEKTDYELIIEYDSSIEKVANCLIFRIICEMKRKGLVKDSRDILKRIGMPNWKSKRYFARLINIKSKNEII